MARRPISLSLRFSVYARDKHTCQYCGGKPPEVVLQLDHVYPVSLGGTNSIDNLLTACRDCNLGKGARDPGLAMASRPATRDETRYLRQWHARWWAQDALWTTDLAVRCLAWSVAAKAHDEVIVSVRSSEDDEILCGLVAIGVIQVRFVGTKLFGIQIAPYRGRAVDRREGAAEIQPGPWSLVNSPNIQRAPSVSEVH